VHSALVAYCANGTCVDPNGACCGFVAGATQSPSICGP
jgi:hypothetical protein